MKIVDGINLATPKGFDVESRKPKISKEISETRHHCASPSADGCDIEKIILTLQAASARTHFRAVLWAQMPMLWQIA